MIQWRVVCNHSLTSISTNFSQSDLRLQEHLLTETCYYTRTMIGSNSLSKQIRGSWALMTSAEVVKLGNNCFVWVPHNQNASSSKLLIDQGSWVVVCLLYNSWAIFPTSYLAPESSHEQLEVFVNGTSKHSCGSLYQISYPCASTSRVACESTSFSWTEDRNFVIIVYKCFSILLKVKKANG